MLSIFLVGHSIPAHLALDLVAPISLVEIKQVIFFSLKNSCSRPDGLKFEFYKLPWDLLSESLFGATNNFFL